MRKLTTRQHFAVVFTLYVFCFFVVFFALFYAVFGLMSSHQLKKELFDDTKKIISNHLLLNNDQIIFRNDKTGTSLKEFLLSENASALILDGKNNILRSYGLFVFNEPVLTSVVNEARTASAPIVTNLVLDKQNLYVLVTSLKNNRQPVGTLIIGISTIDQDNLKRTMVSAILILGFIGILGSFIVGYVLAGQALTPLIRFARVVEKMDLDQLDFTLKFEGNPQDELVLLVNRFNEMTLRLKKMAARQKEFVANASHELKTPLTRAISSIEALPPSLETAKELNLIKDDLFQINLLLDKLLLLTHLKKDSHGPYRLIELNIKKLFDVMRRRLEKPLKQGRVTLLIETPPIIKTFLPYEYLEIILSNFISNAVKYSDKNKTVSVKVNIEKKETLIRITDEGIGMTKEEISHMFDRFYRAEKNQKRGYGIGLSIAKQICDIYNVPIKIESEKGRGTTVVLSLGRPTN